MNCTLNLKPTDVYATRANQDGGTVHITINRLLSDLTFFRLFVPCAMIDSLIASSLVDINDETTSYPLNRWMGNQVNLGSIRRFYCNGDNCCCDKFLPCITGRNRVHVQILNNI